VLSAIFEDIEVRATAPKERPRGKRLKGKSWVPFVLRYLRKLCVLGCRDLVGLTGEIIAQIQERYPEFEITTEAFADVLKLIAATGSGLIAPREEGARIWRVRLAELADPTSNLHRQLCCETWGRSRVDDGASQTSFREREPTPRGPGRARAEHADPPRATDGTNTAAGERDSGAQDKSSVHALANETVPTPAASGDAAERPAVANHVATVDLASDESTEAALRLVDQLSRIPLAGPLLLLWTHTHEFTATVSQLGRVAANGDGVEEVEAESGNDAVLPVKTGAPDACTVAVSDSVIDEADAVRDSVVDAQALVGEAAPVGESVADDEAGAPESGAVGSPGDEGSMPVADALVGVGGQVGDAEALAAVRDALIAGAVLKRGAPPARRRTWTPPGLVVQLVQRALQRPVHLGILGPRGPPVRTSP
jgi:hypothetical protein